MKKSMLVKRIISLLLCLVCMSLLTLPLVGCNSTPEPEPLPEPEPELKELHVFDFGMPEGFDTLSPEEQLEWAKENEYFVQVTKYTYTPNRLPALYDEIEYYNYFLLNSFLKKPIEGSELLIMYYAKEKNQEVADVTFYGLYFDGGRYHLGIKEAGRNDVLAYSQYKICGMEVWRNNLFLYVSNDSELTFDIQMHAISSSSLATKEELYKKYYAFLPLMK